MQTKREYREKLKRFDVDILALPYAIVTGKSARNVTKNAAIDALVKVFDADLADCQDEYIKTLSHSRREALLDYRGRGYVQMNNALRTGKMPVHIDSWILSRDISKALWTKKSDLDKLSKSPGVVAKALCAKASKLLENQIRNSIQSDMRTWNKIEEMKGLLNDTPSRTKDTVLWRGESFRPTFHLPNPSQFQSHQYSNQMQSLSVGKTFVRPDFSSFSMCPLVAFMFADRDCCMYRLNLPKDQPALFTESFQGEYEVILPPGTVFRTDKVQRLRSEVSPDEFTIYHISIQKSRRNDRRRL